MSNRALVAILIIIIVLLAGAAVFYSQQKNSRKLADSGTQASEPESTKGDEPLQEASSTPPQNPAPDTDQTANGDCKRNFISSKLQDAMNIKNRQVEISVKDFGKITLELYDKDAPKAVENFLRLINAGYYNCVTFHRIAKNFVIQGGDPEGTGRGGESAFGAAFEDELNPNSPSYKAGYVKGVLAMANSGPNTNGSQFFIMLANNDLPHNYTIFGKVIAGQAVVDKIGQVDITPQMGPADGSPKTPVVMDSVRITK